MIPHAPLALAALVGLAVLSLGAGTLPVPPGEVAAILADAVGLRGGSFDPLHATVVLSLRLPRLLVALVVGASLAVAGALVQGWFRNPLAEPSLLGVSGGASLAAATAIVLLDDLPLPVTLPGAAFVGGLLAVAGVVRLSAWSTPGDRTTLLLAGLALSAVAAAGTGLLVTVADDDELRDLTFWTLGSVGGATWSQVTWVTPALLVGLAAAWPLARPLDGLLLGEASAAHLGVDVAGTQRRLAVTVAWLVGVAVAATGMIGFVGLIAPHLARRVTGPRHARLLPAAAVVGAALLVGADLLARTAASPLELPIGVLTTLLGGPMFLVLLLGARGGVR